MKIEMKKMNYKIVLGILLIVALVGAVFLVQQRQETRRGATNLDGFIRLFLGESSTTKEIAAGQEFTVPIVANITGAGGVDSVVAYFCYDPTKIDLKDTSALENSFTVSSPTSYVGGLIKVNESNNKCVKVTFVSVVQNTKLSSSVAMINFKTVASSGTGTISIDKSKSSLGVAGQDTVDINSVGNLSYSISSSMGDCTPTSNNSTGCSSNYGCMKISGNYKGIDGDCKNPLKDCSSGSIKYVPDTSCPAISEAVLATLGSSGNNDACNSANVCTPTSNNSTGCSSNYGCMRIDGNYLGIDGDCKNPVTGCNPGAIKYVVDDNCPRISDAVLATLGSSGNNDACGAVSTVVNGNCSTSRNTCTSGELDDIEDSDTEYKWNCVGTNGGTTDNCSKTKSAGDAVVDIKLAFAGVKKDNGKCAVNWPVTVKVLNNAGVNVLDDTFSATPTQTTSVNSKGEIIYDYNVTVSNVPTAGVGNLAFFLTGSKHISVKYGENNQKAWFSNLAGSLSLTRGETSSYDFSEYPLTTGDVNGDGKINGQDYSYIKEKANVLTSGNTGTSVDGDINGDCQVNSGDIALIKKSLKEVNGQTY
ncbi:MAG: dockerin type I domain-containing protein [Candidatus Shapirobacteria bacterium]|nr:dockerin type I domain-containing protein [Candidatus Shapirobacteria bacterium]